MHSWLRHCAASRKVPCSIPDRSLKFFIGIILLAEGKRPLGKPRRRWEDNIIKMDLQEVGGSCGDWMELAQDRGR